MKTLLLPLVICYMTVFITEVSATAYFEPNKLDLQRSYSLVVSGERGKLVLSHDEYVVLSTVLKFPPAIPRQKLINYLHRNSVKAHELPGLIESLNTQAEEAFSAPLLIETEAGVALNVGPKVWQTAPREIRRETLVLNRRQTQLVRLVKGQPARWYSYREIASQIGQRRDNLTERKIREISRLINAKATSVFGKPLVQIDRRLGIRLNSDCESLLERVRL